jgi:cation:H+ antiporter
LTETPLVSSICLIVSLGLLWKGADFVIHSAARIARRHQISDLVIGMTVVALGTSAPEIVVTLVAAFKGQGDIALGNVVGSNVFNMGLILGATAVLGNCPTPRIMVRRDAPVLFLATIFLLVTVWDLALDRWQGLLMLVFFAGYLVYVFRRDEGPLEQLDVPSGTATFKDGPLLLFGLAAVVVGGELLVESASGLAESVGVPTWAIAVTIVAAGTSAPECATCIAAALHGRYTMAAGNLIGSDLFNILGVLGLAIFAQPMQVSPVARGSVVLMVAMVALVLFFMRSGFRLTRGEGFALILFALMRWGRDVASDLWR